MSSTAYYDKVNLDMAMTLGSIAELDSVNDDMVNCLELAQIACKTAAPVLITGETGVGKSLLAMAIHYTSPKRTRPCVTMHCAGRRDHDIKTRLFGGERGGTDTPGMLAEAGNGTLIIDGVDILPSFVQRELLDLLTVRKDGDGAASPRKLPARLISTSGSELTGRKASGRFVEDLIYCLGEITIRVPPLRQRREDLPALTATAIAAANRMHGKSIQGLSHTAQKFLCHYDFPGNVRELFLMINRAVKGTDRDIIFVEDLGLVIDSHNDDSQFASGIAFPSLEEMERRHIARALLRTGWKRRAAARLLHISESMLERKIRVYGLERGGSND